LDQKVPLNKMMQLVPLKKKEFSKRIIKKNEQILEEKQVDQVKSSFQLNQKIKLLIE